MHRLIIIFLWEFHNTVALLAGALINMIRINKIKNNRIN